MFFTATRQFECWGMISRKNAWVKRGIPKRIFPPGMCRNPDQRPTPKSRRAQASVLHKKNDTVAYTLAIELAQSTPDDQFVFNGISLPQYQNVMGRASAILGLAGYTCHGPRAGWASDALLSGREFVSIREEGRWLSDASLRVYLDVVGTAQQSATADLVVWESEIRFLTQHLLDVLPRWAGCDASPTRAVPKSIVDATRVKPAKVSRAQKFAQT